MIFVGRHYLPGLDSDALVRSSAATRAAAWSTATSARRSVPGATGAVGGRGVLLPLRAAVQAAVEEIDPAAVTRSAIN
jgi:hypothetical protein